MARRTPYSRAHAGSSTVPIPEGVLHIAGFLFKCAFSPRSRAKANPGCETPHHLMRAFRPYRRATPAIYMIEGLGTVQEMLSIATWMRQCDEHWFAPIFCCYPGFALHNARFQPVDMTRMDALLLTGGGDISPGFLRQPVERASLIVDTDCVRDEWEFKAAATMLSTGKPILAICRGLQVLNVTLGGTLHIDIPDNDNAETENIQPLRHSAKAVHRYAAVNSSH